MAEWLTYRPIAHRGLHNAANGVIENTTSAFSAAVDGRFGIECDVQISSDAEAMVHHDRALGRLTEGSGLLSGMTAAELKDVAFHATNDRMMTLAELCELVGGRVPLLVEIKSEFNGDPRLATRVAEVLHHYRGQAAAMSFDPEQLGILKKIAPDITRGIVAERRYRHAEWSWMGAGQRFGMAHLVHVPRTQPEFIAYHVKDLPTCMTGLSKRVFRVPLLAWTVRTEEDRARAARYASQMIFEGFKP